MFPAQMIGAMDLVLNITNRASKNGGGIHVYLGKRGKVSVLFTSQPHVREWIPRGIPFRVS